MSSRNRNMTRARRSAGVSDPSASAPRATAIAPFVSAAEARATSVAATPRAGLYTGADRPEPPAVALPPTKCPSCWSFAIMRLRLWRDPAPVSHATRAAPRRDGSGKLTPDATARTDPQGPQPALPQARGRFRDSRAFRADPAVAADPVVVPAFGLVRNRGLPRLHPRQGRALASRDHRDAAPGLLPGQGRGLDPGD